MTIHVDKNGDVLEVGDMVTYNGGTPFKINDFKLRSYGYVVYDGEFTIEPKFVEKVPEQVETKTGSTALPKGWNF